MKKIILIIISIIAIFYLLCEIENITITTLLLKSLSLLWLFIIAKANNYFYQEN